ncbi:MAG: CvpA family protein [Erysipelotrichaceae bacterium]|nr:CvpA family protein [Erysipelotrichaceae bacterium]
MTLPPNSVMFINIGVIAVIVISLIIGYVKGFLWSVLKIIGLLAIIILAWILSSGLSDLIQIFPRKYAPFASTGLADLFYGKINTICWFLILFVAGLIILAILKPLFKVITEIPVIKGINKTLGALLSLIPAFLFIVVVTFILNSAIFANGKEIVNNSLLRYTDDVINYASNLFKGVFSENVAIQKMINDPKSLTEDDLGSIVTWMKNNKISADSIREFLTNYGIDVDYINKLLSGLTD